MTHKLLTPAQPSKKGEKVESSETGIDLQATTEKEV